MLLLHFYFFRFWTHERSFLDLLVAAFPFLEELEICARTNRNFPFHEIWYLWVRPSIFALAKWPLSISIQESEWLRVTLHKWLDDEYCPEATNVDISKVAAHSFYTSLLEKKTDLGEILLKMARELESISYQESFHGAFSSANAAVNLIVQRIEQA